jgi:Mn2+/Fe2+ NRAMP family transporter
VLIASAATIGKNSPGMPLDSVGHMAQALTPFLGTTIGNAVFGVGIVGAGMLAAIVVSLTLAWGLGEVTGYRRSLADHPLEARWFYGIYALCVIGGCTAVGLWPDLVALNIGVQVINTLVLPVVLGLLVALARSALPDSRRLRGVYFWVVVLVFSLTSGLGVLTAIAGLGSMAS